MGRLRNYRHELMAQALAEGKSREQAFAAAGYPADRGNHNRLAQRPDVMARVGEIRRGLNPIVDIRKLDRGRLLIELARIACADIPMRGMIAEAGPEGVRPDQAVLKVEISLDGAFAKRLEMRLLDDRGAITSLLHYDEAPDRPAMDFSSPKPDDSESLERVLRALVRNREIPNPPTEKSNGKYDGYARANCAPAESD
jgi:hypothetical protein